MNVWRVVDEAEYREEVDARGLVHTRVTFDDGTGTVRLEADVTEVDEVSLIGTRVSLGSRVEVDLVDVIELQVEY